MSVQHSMSSFARSLVALLALGAVFASGCAGKSTGDDDEDGDNNGGSSSVGGTAGTLGGTSSGSSNCTRACQLVQVCPDSTPVDCAAECRDLDAEAVAAGCSAPYQNFLACLVQSSDACNAITGGECENATEAYVDCIGGGSSGNCNSATAPPADCTALCQRAQACPDATPIDCAASCAQELASMAELGCSQQYQSVLTCISTCTNVCSITTTECEPEFDALIDCAAL